MKKNIKTIIILLILAVLAGVVFFNDQGVSETTSGPLRDFAVADTSSVGKFTISDTEGNLITITRDNAEKTWMVEGSEFKAKPENATLALEAFKSTVIRQDLDESKIKTTMNYLAVRHKKVAIYKFGEDQPFKTWYIGNATPNHQGTFMLLQKKKQKSTIPFIVYKPGLRGSLDARFFTSFKDWQYTGVYNYGVGEIRKIEVINNDKPSESFIVNVNDQSALTLLDGKNNPVPVFDTTQVAHYVTHFKKMHFNHVVTDHTEAQMDSIQQITPDLTFKVTDKNNSTKTVDIWKIMEVPPGDSIKKLNVNYVIASINKSKDLVRLQYYQWDNVLKPLGYFLPRK